MSSQGGLEVVGMGLSFSAPVPVLSPFLTGALMGDGGRGLGGQVGGYLLNCSLDLTTHTCAPVAL